MRHTSIFDLFSASVSIRRAIRDYDFVAEVPLQRLCCGPVCSSHRICCREAMPIVRSRSFEAGVDQLRECLWSEGVSIECPLKKLSHNCFIKALFSHS